MDKEQNQRQQHIEEKTEEHPLSVQSHGLRSDATAEHPLHPFVVEGDWCGCLCRTWYHYSMHLVHLIQIVWKKVHFYMYMFLSSGFYEQFVSQDL